MIEEVAEKIRRVEIQGATNVAVAALRAVKSFAEKHGPEEVHRGIDTLLETRPTEPLMRNTLLPLKSVEDPAAIVERVDKLLHLIDESASRLVEIGARLVEDGSVVQTICHSSTVVKILLRARDEGKQVRAVVTETRPLYQGRITAEELYKGGVPVKFYADSAMYLAMEREKVDMCLVGLDAIFVDGSIVNKVGTGLLALAAEARELPFYACGLALKLDRGSLMAKSVSIEQRDPRELWSYPVAVENPAFEVVPAKRIKGITTELGVLPPAMAYMEITKNYDLQEQ